jgi:hypothetical protein
MWATHSTFAIARNGYRLATSPKRKGPVLSSILVMEFIEPPLDLRLGGMGYLDTGAIWMG